jgi:hypothetical protein
MLPKFLAARICGFFAIKQYGNEHIEARNAAMNFRVINDSVLFLEISNVIF